MFNKMEVSTNDMLQAGANYSAALTEIHDNKIARENEVRLNIWDWQKYFEASKEVLTVRTETKGDTVYTTSIEATPELKDLSRQVLSQLMLLASKNLEKVTNIYN